jgi:3'-phosphoadenosine 5'-phosphosulfate sulfotransferase (PAPS reductase)/FAD synthetase
MTTEMEQVRRSAQQHCDDFAFVVNQSGGKDSTGMMGLVRQTFPYAPTYADMADTGFEHIAPVKAANWART